MTNRRRFLQSAAALSAAPLAARAAFPGHPETTSPAAGALLVFDSRYPQATAFGERASALGAPLRAIEGDITGLWVQELRARWTTVPATPVIGLTERPALFLLERLAWDHGLRVLFQAEHVLADAGHDGRHRLLRSADSTLDYSLERAGRDWPTVLAEALLRGHFVTANHYPTDAAMAETIGDCDACLYSWVIAPRNGSRT